jgi:hypothetical protein
MKTLCTVSRTLTTLLLTAAMAAQAADDQKVKYVPPAGFSGHAWGDLLSGPGFSKLPLKAIGVGAAWTQPSHQETSYTCVPGSASGSQMNGATGGCDFQATLLTLRQRHDGGEFYVLSEYTVDDQGARYGDEPDAVLLHPVIYQFCANWDSPKREVPAKFDEKNKFCGVRLMFQTETSEELRKLPADHVTNYDRVLAKLVARFGKPDKASRRGRVVIETMDDDTSYRQERQNRVWRWCSPASERGTQTSCTASVVLSLEPATGAATVLYSTPQLWQFAHARENNGYKGDKLFRLLHARN